MQVTTSSKVKTTVYLGLIAICGLFQNFDFATMTAATLQPINQKSRTTHAKELLGHAYNGSPVQRAEKIKDLQIAIYDDVRNQLPTKYKSHSLALAETIIREAQAHDMDPVFVMAVIKTESSFNPKARGSHGEIGLMQLKPDTAKWIAEQTGMHWQGSALSLENPIENVRFGIAYISHLRDHSDGFANKYVSAYNMGLEKVRRMYSKDQKPHEYSSRVMHNYRELYVHMMASRTTIVAGN